MCAKKEVKYTQAHIAHTNSTLKMKLKCASVCMCELYVRVFYANAGFIVIIIPVERYAMNNVHD
jgi:hypothetical protein